MKVTRKVNFIKLFEMIKNLILIKPLDIVDLIFGKAQGYKIVVTQNGGTQTTKKDCVLASAIIMHPECCLTIWNR